MVSEEELGKLLRAEKFSIDMNAHAVVISEKGSVFFTYSDRNTYNWLKVERMVRVIDSWGTRVQEVTVPLGWNQTIASVSTMTYNLKDGKRIVYSEPEKAYEEIKSDSGRFARLNFKDVVPGSVIYYTYTVRSARSYNIPQWYFEGRYPVLHSEFMVTSAFGLEFAVISNKNVPFPPVDNEKDIMTCGNCRFDVNLKNTTQMTRSAIWAKNNVPAATGGQETKWDNIRVQLAKIRVDKQLPNSNNAYNLNRNDEYLQDVELTNWAEVNNKLLYNYEFLGKMVFAANGFLKEPLEAMLTGKTTEEEKAKTIYEFVKNDIRLKDNAYGIYASEDMKTVFREKAGTVADKNLLLASMLRRAGLNAEPLVLVTTDYEPLRQDFPVYSALNYVAVKLNVAGKEYLLDASDPSLTFGRLRPECYNGLGYAVNKTGSFVLLGNP